MDRDEVMEAVANSAYHHHAKCPCCGNYFHRANAEKIVYCNVCGQKLHLRAFTEKEISDARWDREMDSYED